MFENIRADIMRVHLRPGMMRVHRCTEILRPIDVLYSLWLNEGLRALVIYRFGQWLGRIRKHRLGWAIAVPLYPVYRLLSICARIAYGIDLDQSANIAPGFYINHYGGIEVRNCRIGPSCNIQQQVKLGSAETTARKTVIGEEVYIGAHSRICTEVSVGDGATIGAGAVITQDIPRHCLVIGNPGRVVQRNYDNRSVLYRAE